MAIAPSPPRAMAIVLASGIPAMPEAMGILPLAP